MMSKLRENAKFFLWFTLGAFLFGFIAIMGFQAIGNKANNPEIVAKIDKENVTYTELAQSWRNQLQEMNSRGIKVSEEREKELKKEMLYDIIETKLKLNYAAKLGIMVSDEEVAESIMSIRAFLNKDGQFDKEQYTNYLYSQRIKPAEFEGQQRQYIMLVKLRNQLWSGIKYSQDELKSYFMKRQRSLNADYVYFNYKDYLKEIKITDDKLKDYYALHKKEYEKPERVKAS
ncbi:MAG TPA: SurA N-terminal domain-containing protein, partial [Candidatus Goldiibacteriota bacterium]|nr:SurA N-terminal domain-containing protein [Candidatus Goldiibacteriota bacterium]